jgi:hypothetical protein
LTATLRFGFSLDQGDAVHKSIGSRDCTLPNKALIAEWIETYGEDSDFVRVRGLPPAADELQFIDRIRILEAGGARPTAWTTSL